MTVHDKYFDLKITLNGTEPAVWRQIHVPCDAVLGELHALIQMAMGWENSHLFEFVIGGKSFALDPDESDDFLDIEIYGLLKGVKAFEYRYDFGDGWRHSIEVLGLKDLDDLVAYPICVGGMNACPPEDCGGIAGFYKLIEAFNHPEHEEHENTKAWVGGYFDPKGFDANMVNKVFRAPMDLFDEDLEA